LVNVNLVWYCEYFLWHYQITAMRICFFRYSFFEYEWIFTWVLQFFLWILSHFKRYNGVSIFEILINTKHKLDFISETNQFRMSEPEQIHLSLRYTFTIIFICNHKEVNNLKSEYFINPIFLFCNELIVSYVIVSTFSNL
jgi:hypothetical protein